MNSDPDTIPRAMHAVWLYLIDSVVVRCHCPIEVFAVVCCDPDCGEFHSRPVKVVVPAISVCCLFVSLIVLFCLFSDALHPVRDYFRLRWGRQTRIANLEVSDGNCADDPILHVVRLVGRHFPASAWSCAKVSVWVMAHCAALREPVLR